MTVIFEYKRSEQYQAVIHIGEYVAMRKELDNDTPVLNDSQHCTAHPSVWAEVRFLWAVANSRLFADYT